jgi:hypothetical protein
MRCTVLGFVVLTAISFPSGSDCAEPTELAIHEYFYIDFPRQLQLLQNEKQLAEAELDLIARRVESYRPFRSFGRYAATHTVDQSWQIALLAAQQRLECLRNDEADLWRQRRALAAAYQIESSGLQSP